MLQLHIENVQLFNNGTQTQLDQLTLGAKIKEVLAYLLRNNIRFDFQKQQQHIWFSSLRPDLKSRLINALLAERLIRPHGI